MQQNALRGYATCHASQVQYAQGGEEPTEGQGVHMYEDIHSRKEGDVTGLGAALELAPL